MKIHTLILAVLLLTVGTATLTAQVNSTFLRDQQVKALIEQLQLTAEQQEKAKVIYDKLAEQLRVVYQDQNTTPEEKHKQTQTLREASLKQVKIILNKEQAEKFEKLQTANTAIIGNPQERAAKIAEELGLKPEQKEKFAAIAQEQTEKMRAIYRDQNTTPEEKAVKMREAGDSIMGKLKEILTVEQFEKLTKMRAGTKEQAARPAAANPQERVAKLVGELGLKPEQKEKFAAIVQDQTSSREEKVAKLKELLTPEQFENLLKLRN